MTFDEGWICVGRALAGCRLFGRVGPLANGRYTARVAPESQSGLPKGGHVSCTHLDVFHCGMESGLDRQKTLALGICPMDPLVCRRVLNPWS